MEAALKAVSSKRRRDILRLVWDRELASRRIADHFDLTWPAVSQNLRILRDAGLVIERREGNRRLYRAHREMLRPLESILRDMWIRDLDRLRELAERDAAGGNRDMETNVIKAVQAETRVKADRVLVFSFFTDAAKFRRWQGLDAELEPRPGGIFRIRMSRRIEVRGEYLVVDPPNRLVFTWGCLVNDALPVGPQEVPEGIRKVAPGSSTVEVNFVVDGDDTIVRVRHAGLPSDDSCAIHRLQWMLHLERLVTAARGGDPGPEPLADF